LLLRLSGDGGSIKVSSEHHFELLPTVTRASGIRGLTRPASFGLKIFWAGEKARMPRTPEHFLSAGPESYREALEFLRCYNKFVCDEEEDRLASSLP